MGLILQGAGDGHGDGADRRTGGREGSERRGPGRAKARRERKENIC